MIRFTGFRQWMGQSTCTSGVVGQLGMEMIPLCPSRSAAFTSGTTSGTSGSMRQAELSSMTMAPALTAAGIMLLETSVVAEKKARSTPGNDFEFGSSPPILPPPTAPEPAGRAHLQLRLGLREEVAFNVGGPAEARLQEAGALAAEGPAGLAIADLGGDVSGHHLRLAVGEHPRLRQHLAVGQRDGRHVPHRVYALERRRQGGAGHFHPATLLGEAGLTHNRRHLVERHAA